MARIRTIKPEFCSSKDAGGLTREARLFFLLMFTEVDDFGRALWIPRRLCGVLYPHDEDVTPEMLTRWCAECEPRGMLIRYAVADVEYLQVTNWHKHQKISHPTESRLPTHDSDDATILSESLRNLSRAAPETLRPDLGTGKGNREGEQATGICGSPNGAPAAANPGELLSKPICITNTKAERLRQVSADAVATFNAILGKPIGQLAAVHLVNEVREDQVKRCIPIAREICRKLAGPEAQITPKFWTDYWSEIDKDPFKSGRQRGGKGHENWVPDFEYLTRKEVLTAVFDKAMSEEAA